MQQIVDRGVVRVHSVPSQFSPAADSRIEVQGIFQFKLHHIITANLIFMTLLHITRC